ncbi:MAG: glycosyltransferase family 2 protein [Candidatus Hydrogenedentes bacterium]|nr:glycosyltransferase family 2 protein [Candidatus Hydrogenedentota bacterium]
MHLSIVIPAYNEASRIPATLRRVDEYLSRQTYDSEIVVVDDGSTDDTAAAVRDTLPGVHLVSYGRNYGKGHAVKTGMMVAVGAYRVFYDADASTPIEELERLLPCFYDGADIVIGSRSLPESDVQVRQTWYREQMGRMFNRLLRLLALTSFPDTQCGFKGFTAEACRIVFPRQTLDRFSFDAELLFIAELHGLRIDQLPVRWINCPHTRVNALLDSLGMMRDIIRVRRNKALGKYR